MPMRSPRVAASGATVYTLSDTASDAASQKLAERHDREDLLAGVDLSRQDDVIAGVLMDLARTETQPRSDRLADALVAGLRDERRRPAQAATAGGGVLGAEGAGHPLGAGRTGVPSSDRDGPATRLAPRLTDPPPGAWAAADAAERS